VGVPRVRVLAQGLLRIARYTPVAREEVRRPVRVHTARLKHKATLTKAMVLRLVVVIMEKKCDALIDGFLSLLSLKIRTLRSMERCHSTTAR
jgi:accessory gene regulator protein AgrB